MVHFVGNDKLSISPFQAACVLEKDTEVTRINQRFRQVLQQPFNKQISFSTSSSKTPFNNPYKPGGTITAVTGSWTSRIYEKGEEPSGTGLWSYLKLRGRNNTKVIIITLYRLCSTTPQNVHESATSFSQMYSVLNHHSLAVLERDATAC